MEEENEGLKKKVNDFYRMKTTGENQEFKYPEEPWKEIEGETKKLLRINP